MSPTLSHRVVCGTPSPGSLRQSAARSRPDGAGSSAHDWALAGITSSGPAVSVTSARCDIRRLRVQVQAALWLSDSESSQCAADLSIIESVTGQGCNLNVGPAAARVLPRPKHWPGESSGDSGPVSLSHLACRYDSSCLISRCREYRAQGGF